MVGGEDRFLLPCIPGGLELRLHQGRTNAPAPVCLLHTELEQLALALPLKLQHDHAHNLLPPAGQQHPATAGQEAVGLRQHLQIHRLQQVVFQQPGQGDVLQRLLVAILIVDNREASALVHGFTPPFLHRIPLFRRPVNARNLQSPPLPAEFSAFTFNLHPEHLTFSGDGATLSLALREFEC